MKFKITHHAGFKVPEDALDLLLAHLGSRRGEVTFNKVGPTLIARWNAEPSSSLERDDEVRVARRAILEIVIDACRTSPELESDWYAISPAE